MFKTVGFWFNCVANAVYDEVLDFRTDPRVKVAYGLVALVLAANVALWLG